MWSTDESSFEHVYLLEYWKYQCIKIICHKIQAKFLLMSYINWKLTSIPFELMFDTIIIKMKGYFSSKRKGDKSYLSIDICPCQDQGQILCSVCRTNWERTVKKKISWIYCMVYEKYNSPGKLSNHKIHFPLIQANDLKPESKVLEDQSRRTHIAWHGVWWQRVPEGQGRSFSNTKAHCGDHRRDKRNQLHRSPGTKEPVEFRGEFQGAFPKWLHFAFQEIGPLR